MKLTKQQLAKAESLVKSGSGYRTLVKTFKISQHEARNLGTLLKKQLRIPNKSPVNKRELSVKETDLAVSILQKGFGYRALMKPLNISDWNAQILSRAIKAGKYGVFKVQRQSGVNKTENLFGRGHTNYEIANILGITIKSVENNLERSRDSYRPAEKDFKLTVSRGASERVLKSRFGFKNKEAIRRAINESFPDCFVSEINEKEDTVFTPIKSSAEQIESLAVDKSKRQFNYYLAPEQNYMYVKFDDDLPGDTIKIWNFSDQHIGSKYHREEIHDKLLNACGNDPMSFLQLGGDTFEAITKHSVGDPMDQSLNLTQQVYRSALKYSPFAHKITDLVGGNHDALRGMKIGPVDLANLLAYFLKIPYSLGSLTIDYEWRGVKKTQFHIHRYGESAIGRAVIIQKIRKYLTDVTYPIHWFSSGHTHDAWIDDDIIYRIKVLGKGFETERPFVVNAGSFTMDTGSYSELALFNLAPKDLTYIWFDEKGQHGADKIPIDPI